MDRYYCKELKEIMEVSDLSFINIFIAVDAHVHGSQDITLQELRIVFKCCHKE